MRFKLPDNRIVRLENPFEYEGVQYPAYWLRNTDSREALKAVEIIEEPMPDTRLGSAVEDPENPGKWIYTPMSAENRQNVLMDYAALKRWEKQNNGTSLGTPSDTYTQTVLSAAWASAKLDSEFTINWKASKGVYITLDSVAIIAMAEDVRQHIQYCFDLNKQVDEKILANEITTFEEVDEIYSS